MFQWRARGEAGFEARVSRLMELVQYQVKKIKKILDKFYLLMKKKKKNDKCLILVYSRTFSSYGQFFTWKIENLQIKKHCF